VRGRPRFNTLDVGAFTSETLVVHDMLMFVDMMAGAVMYRVLQPDPPDLTEMRRYLRLLYRQVGLLR
jgi:hypothetical protein